MIGYVTLGIIELAKAANFCDALLATIGANPTKASGRFIAWSVGLAAPALDLTIPYDRKPAGVGNGVMVALAVDSHSKVVAHYKMALEPCATGAAAPGPDGEGFYAGYFRYPAGNKLNAFCTG